MLFLIEKKILIESSPDPC